MGARLPRAPAPPIHATLPLPAEDRPLWAPGGPAPPPHAAWPSPFPGTVSGRGRTQVWSQTCTFLNSLGGRMAFWGAALGSPQFTDHQTEAPIPWGPSLRPRSWCLHLTQCGPRAQTPAPTPRHRQVCSPTYLMAEVANTCPLEPTQRTTMEATTTMRSGGTELPSPARQLDTSRGWQSVGQGPMRGRLGPHPSTCRGHPTSPAQPWLIGR